MRALRFDIYIKIFIGMALSTILTGCGLVYSVELANYGENGVLIRHMSYKAAVSVSEFSAPIVAKIYPGVPDGPTIELYRFDGHEKSLPNEIEVTWQLAQLNNCKYVNPSLQSPNHVAKGGCTWTPIEGKTYHKTLDMAAIRNSAAYKKAGTPYQGLAGSKNVLRILLIFNEDQLTVKTYTIHTNPWQ